MAERVVQVALQERVLSRPERPPGRTRRLGRRLWTGLATAGLFAGMSVVTAHYLMVDQQADSVRAASLVPTGAPARVLVVVAHPGDEVPLSGTLKRLDAAGAKVALLSLTGGEARPPVLTQFTSAQLAKVRSDELLRAAEELGIDQVTIGRSADGQLMGSAEKALAQVSSAISKFSPAVLLVAGGERADDADSAGAVTLAVNAAQEPGSTVARVWQVTRGAREADWVSKIAGPVLSAPAPSADVSVSITDSAIAKLAVIRMHGTQNPNLAASYPGVTHIPAPAYFRFFDREYFHLAWGETLS